MTIFTEKEGAAVTVNGVRYRGKLEDFFFPRMEEEDIDDIWFQQDGASCQTANVTIGLLHGTFDPVGLIIVGCRKG